MHNLNDFGVRLERSIPDAEQGSIRNVLAAYHESRAMLAMYSRALDLVSLPTVGNGLLPSVVAFGSIGRLDGSIEVSDYDIMFLYPGAFNAMTVADIKEAITDLVSRNRSFPCDHRIEIETRTFNFDDSPSYPILSEDEMSSMGDETRAIQLLTEARILYEPKLVSSLTTRLLAERYAYITDIHSLALGPLRNGLARLKTAYCGEVYARLRALPKPLSNRKVLKLFTLREFHYLSTLLALAESAIAVRTDSSGNSLESICALLSSPAFLKVASFADRAGTLVRMLLRSQSLSAECGKCLARHAGKSTETDIGSLVAGLSHVDNIRSLVLGVLRPYDRLLGMLHDPAFIRMIDQYEPDITTWLMLPSLRQLLDARKTLVTNTSRLAHAILDILGILEQELGCHAIDEAKATLEIVRNYRLEMDSPAA